MSIPTQGITLDLVGSEVQRWRHSDTNANNIFYYHILYYNILYSTLLYSTIPHYTTLHYTTLPALHCTELRYTTTDHHLAG